MAGNFQDDIRENQMRNLFQLCKDENEGRSGIDAYLQLGEVNLSFELKTTSKGSVTTVRDFGPEHIEKWKNKHWLIGFFHDVEPYYIYASPRMIAPWINEKANYIAPDFNIGDLASSKMTIDDMYIIIGRKQIYTYEDARRLHKMQLSKQEYVDLQDVKNGYSPEVMLHILKLRCKYLVSRGSTLNNPHIPLSFFSQFPRITTNHSDTLLRMVIDEL